MFRNASDDFYSKLDKFQLKARLIVEGFIIGLHKSPYHGFSVEFSEHRQYNHGDSIRNIDWKVFAKTEKYYIRRFEEETNLRTYILLDHSKSMDYSSGKISKLDYARTFAAALTYLMLKQQDAVGLITYNDQITNTIRPKSRKNYLTFIHQHLYNLEAAETTSTASALGNVAGQIKKRSLIVIISDFLDDSDEIVRSLKYFHHMKHEVILFHIQDYDELNFPFKKETEFQDMETGEKIIMNPWQFRKEYKQALQDHSTKIKNACYDLGIEYNPINTDTSYEENFMLYLRKRSKLM